MVIVRSARVKQQLFAENTFATEPLHCYDLPMKNRSLARILLVTLIGLLVHINQDIKIFDCAGAQCVQHFKKTDATHTCQTP